METLVVVEEIEVLKIKSIGLRLKFRPSPSLTVAPWPVLPVERFLNITHLYVHVLPCGPYEVCLTSPTDSASWCWPAISLVL